MQCYEVFEKTLNLKHKEKLKIKTQRCRNTKSENTERRKSIFTKIIGRKYRLIQTSAEKNNDRTEIIYEMQFRNSFKSTSPLAL